VVRSPGTNALPANSHAFVIEPVFRGYIASIAPKSTRRPGISRSVLAPARVGTELRPRVVQVPRGRIARVDLHLDTGIQ
jgi:hypothetical protein